MIAARATATDEAASEYARVAGEIILGFDAAQGRGLPEKSRKRQPANRAIENQRPGFGAERVRHSCSHR